MEPSVDLGLSVTVQIIILVFSLLAVAFFSSSEASLISVNKVRIRHTWSSRGTTPPAPSSGSLSATRSSSPPSS